MIHLGLGNDGHQALIETLGSSHRIRITVDVLDSAENHRDTLSWPEARVLDGEIQMDATSDVSRSCSLTLLDPGRRLPFDPNSPAQGALFTGYFVNVHYGVFVPEVIEDWVDIPVFYGPLTSYESTTETVQLEAQGKEALLLDPHFAIQGYTVPKGMRLDDAIRRVAGKAGETHFDIPDLSTKLPTDRVITPQMEPWNVIQGGTRTAHRHSRKDAKPGQFFPPGYFSKQTGGDLLAIGNAHRHAFYDGRGRLCVRGKPDTPAFTFDEDWLTQPPAVTYDVESFINYVHVKGKKGKGAHKAPFGVATLQASNPLSGQSLARGGVPRFLARYLASELTTKADCEKRAKEILNQAASFGIEASFSSLPMPLLEEDDMVRLETQDYDINFVAKQWTLPLSSSSDMSIGSNKRVKARKLDPWRRMHRHRHRHHHHHRRRHHHPG